MKSRLTPILHRYESEFEKVQDVFELQVVEPILVGFGEDLIIDRGI